MHTLIILQLQCPSGKYHRAAMPIKNNLNARSKAEAIMLQLVAYRPASFEKNMARDLLEIRTATYALIRKPSR
jgi:hypothetical protein